MAPPVDWLILKIAPPKLPFCVAVFELPLCFLPLAAAVSAAGWPPGTAEVSDSVPCSALITVFFGICVSSVSGTNTPWILTSTSPLTVETLNVFPSVGEPGVPPCVVVNVMSGPNVVPAAFDATSRTW